MTAGADWLRVALARLPTLLGYLYRDGVIDKLHNQSTPCEFTAECDTQMTALGSDNKSGLT